MPDSSGWKDMADSDIDTDTDTVADTVIVTTRPRSGDVSAAAGNDGRTDGWAPDEKFEHRHASKDKMKQYRR